VPAAETPLGGGWVTGGVVRVGETVRRPLGPRSPFVHALLRQLEEVGFDGAPRLLGIDDLGREILTFVRGSTPSDCGAIVWSDTRLASVATLLRRFHDATAGSELAGKRDVVCHHDFGPWNLVWRDGVPVAIIDFDEAAPGSRGDDLGYAIWKHLNLGLLDVAPTEQARRMRVVISAYGEANAGDDVVAAVGRAQERMERKLEAGVADDGRAAALALLAKERRWLATHATELGSSSTS
jgi:hypothetical protein